MKPVPDPKVKEAVIRSPEPAATSCRKLSTTHSRLPQVLKGWWDDSLLPLSWPWETPLHSFFPPGTKGSFFEQVKELVTRLQQSQHFSLGCNLQNISAGTSRVWTEVMMGADVKTSLCSRLPAKFAVSSYLLKNVTRAMDVPRVGDCQLEGVWMRLLWLARVTGPQSSFGRSQLKIGVWQHGQSSQELMYSSWNCVLCCKLL